MLGIRTALKPDLECSAAELVYGTTLRIPGDFFGYSQSSGDLDPSDYVQRLRQAMTRLRATPPRPSTTYLPCPTNGFITYDLYSAACNNFGLIINTEKTVVIHQPPPDAAYVASKINLNGAQLQTADNFTYLGSTLSHNTTIHDEVARRISKVSQSFGCLRNTVWNRHGLHISTKLNMYKAVILPMLLYGAKTWTMYKKQARRLSHFHLRPLRRILKLRWQDRIPDTDVLGRMGILSTYVILRRLQLRWSGHLVRMDDEGLLKRLFHGDVATVSRRKGGQVRRYMDTLKSYLRRLQINPANWEDLGRDQPTWWRAMKTGAGIYEANRIFVAKAKHEARKSQPPPPRNANSQPHPTCPRCQQTFRTRISIIGNLRTPCPHLPPPPIINNDRTPEPPLPSSCVASTSAAAALAFTANALEPNTPTNTNLTTVNISDVDSVHICPHCDRTITSHIGLISH
nr:unnamed protein product [Spirometra erinaceieuropaei]